MTSARLYFLGSKWPVESCILQIKWDMARGKLTETWWVLRIRYARKTSVTVPVHCCTSYTTAPRTLLVSRLLCLCTSHSNYIAEASEGLYPANTRTSRSQLSRTSLCSVQLVTVNLQHFPPKKICRNQASTEGLSFRTCSSFCLISAPECTADIRSHNATT